jgi:phospholipase C
MIQRLSERAVVVAGLVLMVAAAAACSGGSAVAPTTPMTYSPAVPAGLERISGIDQRGVVIAPAVSKKISHVIIIVQENRSFDNLFHGYPNATYATTGKNSTGSTITLQPEPLAVTYDWTHRFTQAVTAVDYPKGESMDGFDQTPCGGTCPTIPPCNQYGCNSQYQYVQQSDVQGYWNMAASYVVADHFFSSQLDGSFEGHQYLIAGQSEASWGIPTNANLWGCDGGTSERIQSGSASTRP